MTRTSKALKRLGVAGIAVATIGAGVPAFFATAANAATTTAINLTPDSAAASVGSCVPFTASITPAESKVIDVQISQTTQTQQLPTPGQPTPQTIGFCTLPAQSGPGQQAAPANTTTTAANGDVNSTAGPTCPAATVTPDPAPATTQTNVTRCDAEFLTNSAGQVTFGVTSNRPGTLSITAFVEETPGNPGPTPGNATPANGNATGNNVPNVGEQQDTSTLTVVSNSQNAVTALSCTPPSATAPSNAGGPPASVTFSCLATAPNPNGGTLPVQGVTVSYIITSGPDANSTPQNCSGGITGSNGRTSCVISNTSNKPGTDQIFFYVEQNGQAGPQTSEPNSKNSAVFSGAPRNISVVPVTATPTVGTEQLVTATVKDLFGQPVAGTNVQFQLTGSGRIVSSNCVPFFFGNSSDDNTCFRVTDANGQASVTVRSDQPGTLTVDADILDPNTGAPASSTPQNSTECRQTAGNTTTGANGANASAGNCQATSTLTYVSSSPSPSPSATSASPSASPSATPTASTQPPSPSPTQTPARNNLTLSTSTPLIPAGASATLTGTGSANQQYQLQCYTRPSTTYFTARSGAFNAAGDPVTFTLSLGRNTRCFLQYATNSASGASPSLVINVRTVLSLSTVRTAVRTYIFQGRNLPRVAGQLITLYRVDNAGNEIRTTNLVTDDSGIYRVTRKFTGTGTFQFKVRTPQTLNNAAGVSNTITVNVR